MFTVTWLDNIHVLGVKVLNEISSIAKSFPSAVLFVFKISILAIDDAEEFQTPLISVQPELKMLVADIGDVKTGVPFIKTWNWAGLVANTFCAQKEND